MIPSARKPTDTKTVGLILYPGCQPAGLFATADLLGMINFRAGQEVFRSVWVTGNQGAETSGPIPWIQPCLPISQATCDIWVLPTLWATDPQHLSVILEGAQGIADGLREKDPASEIWCYCSGAMILALTGLVQRRVVTTTWWLEPLLRDKFPGVDWRFSEALHRDGRFLSASGLHGYFGLIANWVASAMGVEIVQELERSLFLPRITRETSAFRSVNPMEIHDPRLRKVVLVAQQMPADAIDLGWACALLGMQGRSFSRFVQSTTGLSAGVWLRRIKLRQVGEALTNTNKPFKEIAQDFGFQAISSLHRGFQQTTGFTPSQYRALFSERNKAGPDN